jgi:hypothetical protein
MLKKAYNGRFFSTSFGKKQSYSPLKIRISKKIFLGKLLFNRSLK